MSDHALTLAREAQRECRRLRGRVEQLHAALRLAADAMRRTDPVYCAAMGVEETTDLEWDAALARVEDALDAIKEGA